MNKKKQNDKLKTDFVTADLDQVTGGAFAGNINPAIVDAVQQTNVKVQGDSPAFSMGRIFQATGQALGNAMHNATSAQQQTTITTQASVTQGVSQLFALTDEPGKTGKLMD